MGSAHVYAVAPPQELKDPEGEGVYILGSGERNAPTWPNPLQHAALLFFGDMRKYRDVTATIVYMRPGPDDHWHPAKAGWRLNLPRRWRPVLYHYCTLKEEDR